jgi:hypothetical protein
MLDFIKALPWMLLMRIFCACSTIQEKYYKCRKIKYKRTCEGFVYKDKSNK